MAINAPSRLNTDITTRDYSNSERDAQAKALANSIQDGVTSRDDTLAKFLLGQRKTKEDLEALKKMNIGPGQTGQVGDAHLSRNSEGKAEAAALKQAHDDARKDTKNSNDAENKSKDLYNKESSHLTDITNAIQTGLNALKDNNSGSKGIIRAAILTSNNLRRFNPSEADAAFNSSFKDQGQAMLNKLGIESLGDGQLSDIQKRNALQYFTGKLSELHDVHDAMKGRALENYRSDEYYDPNREDRLQKNLGKSIDDRIGKIDSFAGEYTKSLGDAAKPPQKQSGSGILDLAKKMIFGPSHQSAPPQQDPQPQAPQQAPQQAPDPLSSILKGPAPQSLQTPPSPQGAEPQPQGLGKLLKPQAPPQPNMLRVKNKATGMMGSLPASEFDPNQYDKI